MNMVTKKGICVFLISGMLMSFSGCGKREERSNEVLWQSAMKDAVFSEDTEIQELVTLTKDDRRVIWDDAGQRVLLLCWHSDGDTCVPGSPMTLASGDIWATSVGEMQAWYAENRRDVRDWELRFAQLLGVHEEEGYTHFSAFWVAPEDVIRPAYITDVTKQMENDYTRVGVGTYKDWFDKNIIWSYFESDYPWTRLGYTYDWCEGESEYGLTEFLVFDGSRTEIAFTCTTEEFVEWLDKQLEN